MESEILVMFCISAFSMESQFITVLNEVYPLGSGFTGLLLAYIISIIIVLSFLLLSIHFTHRVACMFVCVHFTHVFISFCIAQMVAVEESQPKSFLLQE